METRVNDPVMIVLGAGEGEGAKAHSKGHLFEQFMAQMLELYGYEKPTRANVNATSNGIELDITTKHQMAGHLAIVECKAYTSPLDAKTVTNFYGKLQVERFFDPNCHGYLVVAPRLTSPAREQAQKIKKHDEQFKFLEVRDLWTRLKEKEKILPISGAYYISDHALIIHDSGIYTAGIELDSASGTAVRVVLQHVGQRKPPEVVDALARSTYARGMAVAWVGGPSAEAIPLDMPASHEPTVVGVRGSSSDFEYQFPASPQFFIGRTRELNEVKAALLDSRAGVLVLNAKSGWGKSSLALKIAQLIIKAGGHAMVLDARTATRGSYIPEVLRRAALEAQRASTLRLPSNQSWASVHSAMRTIQEAVWASNRGPLLVFFDQFENVFQDPDLTKEFRDFSMLVAESPGRLIVGFSWKTDYVSWAEGHPYAHRDEIRSSAVVVSPGPFGAREVEQLMTRLQRAAGQRLSRELRTRLREHSQGLPWLLKKLSGHILSELRAGRTQEHLVSEALNVKALFDADLAALSPEEIEALRYVAFNAQIHASDLVERFDARLVQTLLDQRLVVQVGDKLDTYWDIFREYLQSGEVPVEDTYILRQTPGSVARWLTYVIQQGGDVGVSDLAIAGNTTEAVIFNVARDMRLLGLCSFVSNRVAVLPEILNADEPELLVKERVVNSLRRHRAYKLFLELAEREGGSLETRVFAASLPKVFPAVEVKSSTWASYSQVFVGWFQYCGLAEVHRNRVSLPGAAWQGQGQLTRGRRQRVIRGSFPSSSPGVAIKLIEQSVEGMIQAPTPREKGTARALSNLETLGAVTRTGEHQWRVHSDLIRAGRVEPSVLRHLLEAVPGGLEALRLLEGDGRATQAEVGAIFRQAHRAEWTVSTEEQVGKFFRGWARAAGIGTGVTSRKTSRDPGADPLF